MSFIQPVTKFWKDFESDFMMIQENKHGELKEASSLRVKSLWSRFLGILWGFVLVPTFTIRALISLNAPLKALAFLVCAIAFAVISHDFIVIGLNQREQAEAIKAMGQELEKPVPGEAPIVGFAQKVLIIAGHAVKLVGMVGQELYHQIPYDLKGTWVAGHLWKFFHTKE